MENRAAMRACSATLTRWPQRDALDVDSLHAREDVGACWNCCSAVPPSPMRIAIEVEVPDLPSNADGPLEGPPAPVAAAPILRARSDRLFPCAEGLRSAGKRRGEGCKRVNSRSRLVSLDAIAYTPRRNALTTTFGAPGGSGWLVREVVEVTAFRDDLIAPRGSCFGAGRRGSLPSSLQILPPRVRRSCLASSSFTVGVP